MNSPESRAKFIDPIPKEVGLGSSKFVPKFRKPADPCSALELNLLWQRVEPLKKRKRTVVISVKVDFSPRHYSTPACSHYW